MKFKLVYADAENLGKAAFIDAIEAIKSTLETDEWMVGKFYGGLSSLNGMVSVGRELGLTFIETSSMTFRKKNLADMTLTVDCLSDVLSNQFQKISEVVLLSQDCDFLPLVYKLKSFGVNVSTPLFQNTEERTEESIIEEIIKGNEVEIFTARALTISPIAILLDYNSELYAKSTLEAYYAKKRDRFLKSNSDLTENQITILKMIPIVDFSFKSVLQTVGISNEELLVDLLKLYSQKMYGRCLSLQDNYAIVSEVINTLRAS